VGGSCYVIDYDKRFRFAASPESVWAAMERLDEFERWWGWLGGFDVQGDGLREGSVLRGTVAPPLPYRMSVQVDVTRCRPARLVDALVSGDLAGPARLRIGADDHGETLIDVAWTLEMRQTAMRLAARVAYPLLRWGHDRVVDSTVETFRARLGAT
jgi:uncharacterized protein YndB with AHSA1/START domain